MQTVMHSLTNMVILRSKYPMLKLNFYIPIWWHDVLCIAHLWWRSRMHWKTSYHSYRALSARPSCILIYSISGKLSRATQTVSSFDVSLTFRIRHMVINSWMSQGQMGIPSIEWHFLLATEYSIRISYFLSGWNLYDWALSARSICPPIWVWSTLPREPKYQSSLQWKPIWRSPCLVL